MSNLLLIRPDAVLRGGRRDMPSRQRPAATLGSYVDRDGARYVSAHVGSYTGSTSGLTQPGSYTDRDGSRRPLGKGTYTRSEL